MKQDLVSAVDVLKAAKVLGRDADQCEKLMESKPDQVLKRNWIRAYFAWVEAMCFFLRRFVLERDFQKRVIRPADIPEFAALSEIKYSVTPKGTAIAESANTRTLDYIGFSLLACGRSFGLHMSLERGDKHGQNLARALRIRDRITHPKSLKHITISTEDITLIGEFADWFSANLEILTNERIKARVRKEAGIAKRTKKKRIITFGDAYFCDRSSSRRRQNRRRPPNRPRRIRRNR